MQFVHTRQYQTGETIAAVATPPGEGGVAIIRISGKKTFEVAQKVFSGNVSAYKSHTAHYGKILDASGDKVDDVLLLVFRDGRSYTGEDTVEIHCHGGSLITRRVLETVLRAGARAALPGEFTFRAFINGKLDLVQAEAVQELIGAKNEHALDAAENQLEGRLSKRIRQYKEELTSIAAILEAWVDFPEEGLEFASFDEVISELEGTQKRMQELLDTFHDGRILHDGLSLCLVGRPNVGKSSLMNALLEKDRAIVSATPGTTRDIVEDHMRISGLNFKLIDTAGIRLTHEEIEAEGIKRSKSALEKADLILLVLDATQGITEEDKDLLAQVANKKCIAVWNKNDLSPLNIEPLSVPYAVQISAYTGKGMTELRKTIDSLIWDKGPPTKEELFITNLRHKEALQEAVDALADVINGLKMNVSAEFVALDLRVCLSSLGIIIGTDITEDVLSAIFSKFCVGK